MSRINLPRRRNAPVRVLAEALELRLFLSTTIVSGQTIAGTILAAHQQDFYTFYEAVGSSFELSLGDADLFSNLNHCSRFMIPVTTAIVQDYGAYNVGSYDLELVIAPAAQTVDSDQNAFHPAWRSG